MNECTNSNLSGTFRKNLAINPEILEEVTRFREAERGQVTRSAQVSGYHKS